MSVQREEIVFTEDESKKHDSSVAFEGGHFSNDLLEFEDGNFSLLSFPLLSLYQLSGSLPLSFSSLSLAYFAS